MKKKIVDIGFGRKTMYDLYKSTCMSSRLQYGLVQLEEKYDIIRVSWKKPTRKGTFINNFLCLTSCDVLFMYYIYPQPLVILAILRLLGFFRKRKVIGISHVSLIHGRNFLEEMVLRCVYRTFDTILFHSPKNQLESIEKGLVSANRTEFLHWGDDLDYVDQHIHCGQGDFFLSTGREQRDFSMLVSAFSKTRAPLEIYTNRVNFENNYEYLEEMQGKYSNIKIEFVEKSVTTTSVLAQKLADCMCVVIPLLKNEVYYCLGLTSIIEAMAMGKPIISSRNLYSPVDIEKEQIGFVVDDEESWIKAIDYMISHPVETRVMGEKARLLAESKFNIRECARQIDCIFSK